MKISVCICAYNAEKTVARTIESVLKQTYGNYEIVVVNDGSTDGTLEIVEQYQRDNPNTIIIKSIPNGGLANARNHGLSLCTGDLYVNLDADDYLEADTFEKAVEVLKQDPQIDICFYGYKSFDETGRFFDFYSETKQYPKQPLTGLEAFQLRLKRSIWICQGNALYRTSLIRDHEIVNHPGMNQGEDMYFISRCLLAARKVACFQGDNFCCMTRSDSMNHSKFNPSFFQTIKLLEQLEQDVCRNYPEQLDGILPYVHAERVIQSLTIIKRMARCFPLGEYLAQAKATAQKLKSIGKEEVWSYLDRKKQLEYMICKTSLVGYYIMTRVYDAVGR